MPGIVILAALCAALRAQVDDFSLGNGAEPSITFNRAGGNSARVVVSYISWDPSSGIWTPIKYRFSHDGQAWEPPVDLHTDTLADPTLASNWSTGAVYIAWVSTVRAERFSFKKSNPDLEGLSLVRSDTSRATDLLW